MSTSWASVGEGPPVIFVHGIGAWRGMWDEVVAQLKDRFRCITYDLRGHGETPKPPGHFGLPELVADLEALRAELGIERAHLVGHSLGGIIVPAYAHAHLDHVRSVALLSTAAFRTEEDRSRSLLVVDAIGQNGMAAALGTLETRWFTDRFIAENQERVAARKRVVAQMDPATYIDGFRVYAETDTGPLLPEIRVPALVLTGEFDPGCPPRLNRRMADALPDSRLVILEGLKHSLLIEAPDLIATHLRNFLTEAEAQQTRQA